MEFKVIAGLGNPGTEYEATYHNVGLMALDAVARAFEAASATTLSWKKHKRLFEYAKADGALLVRPLVFMNTSGAAIKEAMNMCGAMPHELIVLHDESDLPVGEVKIAAGRGAAGHHGVESTIAALHTNEFFRARIGIRPAREVSDRTAGRKAGEFVLARIKKNDEAALHAAFQAITERVLKDE